MPSPEGSSVTFRRVPAGLRRTDIERFARTLQREIAKGRTFDTLIAGDAELRRLNREFRGKDYPTDVLSFPSAPQQPRTPPSEPRPGYPLGVGSGCPASFLGDIAISLARARAQAREFGHPIEQELRILMLHGVLHLCGHDHESDSGAMARAEKRWRAKLRLPGGLIERVRS